MSKDLPGERRPESERSDLSGGRQGKGRLADPVRDGAQSALDALLARGHLADIDRHFGAFVAGMDAGEGCEVALAAALASAHAREGHACLVIEAVAGRSWPDAHGVTLPALRPWLDALGASPAVSRDGQGERRPLVLDARGRLFLERLWTAEQQVAGRLRALAHPVEGECAPPPDRLEAALERLFPGARPSQGPRAAARAAAGHRLCVVTGGPGTGKTTTVAGIVALLIELGLAAPGRIALAAPTGKAAARLQESVRERCRSLVSATPALAEYRAQASTVHRLLLELGRRDGKLAVDALVVDEGSMVDLSLMGGILRALPDGGALHPPRRRVAARVGAARGGVRGSLRGGRGNGLPPAPLYRATRSQLALRRGGRSGTSRRGHRARRCRWGAGGTARSRGPGYRTSLPF